MPVYEYGCDGCDAVTERILPAARRGEPGPCPHCDGVLERRFSRVGVKYTTWGFSSTDGLVADRPGRGSYREISERAERISDGE